LIGVNKYQVIVISDLELIKTYHFMI